MLNQPIQNQNRLDVEIDPSDYAIQCRLETSRPIRFSIQTPWIISPSTSINEPKAMEKIQTESTTPHIRLVNDLMFE